MMICTEAVLVIIPMTFLEMHSFLNPELLIQHVTLLICKMHIWKIMMKASSIPTLITQFSTGGLIAHMLQKINSILEILVPSIARAIMETSQV